MGAGARDRANVVAIIGEEEAKERRGFVDSVVCSLRKDGRWARVLCWMERGTET